MKMRRLDYYVASSLDGYIEGKNSDISAFIAEGEGVAKYLSDLQKYDTVIMGRKTYEFGYQFGLKPGSLAYPHMEHFIISSTLSFDLPDKRLHIIEGKVSEVLSIKESVGTPIYFCGGGETAGWMLENNLIDRLIIKLNPMLLGEGTRMFGNTKIHRQFKLINAHVYSDDLIIATYDRPDD